MALILRTARWLDLRTARITALILRTARWLESEVAGRGTTVRGQAMINKLREERDAQLRRQRMPKRKGSEPNEDGSRDHQQGVAASSSSTAGRGTLPPPIPPGTTVPGATVRPTAASSD